MEGESGLVMAGVMVHTGDMMMGIAIAVAASGGFLGDQIYFYIGRFNRNFILKKMKSQRRKFALATLLLRKYGWIIIFMQRYLYGLRTIIPMSIGTTKYSAIQFAIINFFSAIVWASITIVLAYIFGKEILTVLHFAKDNFMFVLPLIILAIIGIISYFHVKTKK
jgi:membrane protein DedA with SNARE-associated domain